MYKINTDLMVMGMNELLKEKINKLEELIETGGIVDTKKALEEYYLTKTVARSISIDTSEYDIFLINNQKIFLEKGIMIK